MYTMCVGHIVLAELVKETVDEWGNIHLRWKFLNHIDGGQSLCLDFGQNWTISLGEEFDGNEHGPARALYYIKGTRNEEKLKALEAA